LELPNPEPKVLPELPLPKALLLEVLPKPPEVLPKPPPVLVLLLDPNRPPPVLFEFEPKRFVEFDLLPKRELPVLVLLPNAI
jgi:hypothetical protein